MHNTKRPDSRSGWRRWASRSTVALGAVLLAGSVLSAVPASAAAAPSGKSQGPGISAPAAKTTKTPAGLPTLNNGYDKPTPAELAAAAQAHSTGTPVAVAGLTTETQQILANPKGGFTAQMTPVPVRTERNGQWVAIDTTLQHTASGYSPSATAYGTVTFSPGGTGPLATSSYDGTSYAVSWPGALPAPTVSGSTATYPNVLPGVDLVMSATVTGGFSDVLVVHDATAARDPALASIRLSTRTTGGHVTTDQSGDLAIKSSTGQRSLVASGASMWDSNTNLTAASGTSGAKARAAAKPGAPVGPDASDADHPGLAARVAAVTTKADAGSLTVIPDQKLLTGTSTDFPLFIDPSFNWHPADSASPAFDEVKQGYPCNSVSLFNNKGDAGDDGNLGVGNNIWNSCVGTMRAYYQFQLPGQIRGAIINLATVNATETYTATCSGTRTVDLHWTGAIGGGTDWNSAPGTGGGALATASLPPAYNPDLCPKNGDANGGFDVSSAIKTDAGNGSTQFTVALTDDTNNSNNFARFNSTPTLQIQYDHAPDTPSALAAVTGGDNAGCATSAPYPYIGRTIQANSPVLRATVTDPDGDEQQATFRYWVDGQSTTSQPPALSADSLPNGGTAQANLPFTFINGLANNTLVDWTAQSSDGEASGGVSSICHFIAMPDPPLKPVITNTDGKYPNSDNGGTAVSPSQTPGQFSVSTPSSNATKFVYGLDQPPAPSNPAAPSVTTNATGVGGVAATPAGHWSLTDGSGSTAADSSGSAKPATLASGASWASDPVRGGVLATNGTTGYANTASSVVNTAQSYSVGAWVKISSLASWATAVSQDGSSSSAFYLQYSVADNKWAFAQTVSDGNLNAIRALSASAPTLNTWTYLVGVFNAANGQMQLYVNGVPAGTATNSTPWSATGPLGIGRGKSGGANSDFFPGQISDVQVYQRALTPAEIDTVYTTTPITVTPDWPGPHNLYAYAEDAAGDISQTYDYPFLVTMDKSVQCTTLVSCMNDTATTSGTSSTPGNTTTIDGVNGLSGTDLASAGWKNSSVAVDGATFALPQLGTGSPDNVLAANQTILGDKTGDPALAAYNNAQGSATGVSSLMFLATATNTPAENPASINGNATAPYVPPGTQVASEPCFVGQNPQGFCAPSGTITYDDGSTSQYYLTVPDWINGPSSLAALTLPDEVTPSGQNTGVSPKIYAFSVPLSPGESIKSVTLPDVGVQTNNGVDALHIFGMSTRVGIANAGAPSGDNWTAAWAGPTEGNYNMENGTAYANQTFRVAVKPSISGGTVRIKLDNALGSGELNIAHATVALAKPTSGSAPPSPVPGSTPVNLSFGASNAAGVTIPEGGMVYANPQSLTVTAGQYLLVSFYLSNSAADLVQHSLSSDAYEYVTPIGSGDNTATTSTTPFTASGEQDGRFTNLVTGVDVATPVSAATGQGTPTQTVVGDNLLDAWQPDTEPNTTGSQVADDLDGAQPTTPTPAGTVAEGIESNELTVDYPQMYAGTSTVGGPDLLSRVDRDILDQPNLGTVIIDEGLQDVLNGTSATNFENAVDAVSSYLDSYGVNVVVIGLTPCGGYTGGGGGTSDPCTSAVDTTRTTLNNWLHTSAGLPSYVDPDATLGVAGSGGQEQLKPAADAGDHVNLSNAGYAALANKYLSPQANWTLADGSGATAAFDSASDVSEYWPLSNTLGSNPATLTGGTSWVSDPVYGEVLKLDGTSGYASTPKSVVDTTASFTVAGWANLSSAGHNAEIVSQDGTQNSEFTLQYDQADNRWAFGMAASDTAGASTVRALSTSVPATGTWTHLVGTYNAITHVLSLYVNGTLVGTATDATPWAATGALAIGRGLTGGANADFFPGELSNVQAFNYALTPQQVAALYQRLQ